MRFGVHGDCRNRSRVCMLAATKALWNALPIGSLSEPFAPGRACGLVGPIGFLHVARPRGRLGIDAGDPIADYALKDPSWPSRFRGSRYGDNNSASQSP